MATEETGADPWTTNFYPREGNGVGFDRVVFFSDAVIAIAVTLMAVEIGLPEVEDGASTSALWHAVVHKFPMFAAYVAAFAWVAFYWRANHRFTATLRGMTGRYIAVVLVYLGILALLPFPAGMLGHYWDNPVAVVIFAVFAAVVSAWETMLFIVADRDQLFIRPVTPEFRRQSIIGSLTPVVGFLLSIPLAFVSTWAAIACWFICAIVLGAGVSKMLPASPP